MRRLLPDEQRPHFIPDKAVNDNRRGPPFLVRRKTDAAAYRGFPVMYDAVMKFAERGRLSAWRRDLVRPVEGTILEVAAGTGLEFWHYPPGTLVIATEPDFKMLELARSRAATASAKILLVSADAQHLPFSDGTFDTIVCCLGLCSIQSPQRALSEALRVLRPGGVARLLEHVRIERRVMGKLQDLLTPAWRKVAGGCRLNERTVDNVRRAGFHIRHLRSHLGGYVISIEASNPGSASRH